MKSTLTVKNNKGFSLVELMVVVAIIGVLASIAVPNINKYIAKARQSEAKTTLSSIFTSEKAFFAEYQAYHSMFGAIGYSPEGKLRYNAGFSGAGVVATAANGYNATPVAPGTNITTMTYCGGTTSGTITNGCATLKGANGSDPVAPTAALTTATGFTAAANAVVFGTTSDIWSITENKELRNTTPGVN